MSKPSFEDIDLGECIAHSLDVLYGMKCNEPDNKEIKLIYQTMERCARRSGYEFASIPTLSKPENNHVLQIGTDIGKFII